MKKKAVEKNKQYEKEFIKKNQTIKHLDEQMLSMKKRVNDLSILKSSNNAIMNEKLTNLTSENEKLKL